MRKLNVFTVAFVLALAMQAAHSETPTELRLLAPQAPRVVPGIDPIITNPTVEEPDVEVYTAGAHYYKVALTSTKPRTTRTEKFVTVPGARTRIVVPAGRAALVNVGFTAESRCNESGSTEPNWCEVRITVDGAEAAPAASSFAPDTYAFDSTDQGSETVASWESHAMDRHKCVDNSKGKTTKVVPVEVQWKVTNFGAGTPAPSFWLDDWSMTVELAKGCRKQTIRVPD